MSRSERFPVSWRYLKARLRILKRRPAVWGSAAGLLAIALASAYWFSNDQDKRLTYNSNASGVASLDELSQSGGSSNPFLSDEESAIGADIDSLPLLLNEMDNSNQPSAPGSTGQPSQQVGVPALPQQPILSGLDADVPLLNDDLSRAFERQQPSQSGTLSGGQTSSSLNSSSSNRIEFNQNRSGSSNSLDGSAGGSAGSSPSSGVNLYESFNSTPSNPTNPLQSAIEDSSPSSSNSSTGLSPAAPGAISGQTNQNLPQTSPPPGTTGYVIPPSLRAPSLAAPNTGAYPNVNQSQSVPNLQSAPQVAPTVLQPQYSVPQSYRPPTSGATQPQVYPNFGYSPAPIPQPQMTQPEPQEAPIRRSGIGRPIGGGEINTFSNP